MSGYRNVKTLLRNKEAALKGAAAAQPVSIAIQANQAIFQHYTGGIISGTGCGKMLDHAVLVIGYGPNYFLVKNSWGESWGEAGYVRISSDSNTNTCGIFNRASYPTL